MGLTLIKSDINIDFLRWRNWAISLSLFIIFVGLISLILRGGPKYGIDFAGGTLIQLKFFKPVKIDMIREVLKGLKIKDVTVQRFGKIEENEYLIRMPLAIDSLKRISESLKEVLEEKLGKNSVEIRRVEMVGPKVGKDLRRKALLALFYAVLIIGIYISGRFEMKWGTSLIMAAALFGVVYIFLLLKAPLPFLVLIAFITTLFLYALLNLRFALGAILALVHDVLITLGIFSLLNKEIDLLIVAAFLTIIGYSLNDTIVVFDRIRENMRKATKERFTSIINRSINETLSRTVLTSGTTLMALLALYLFGGGVIHNFAFALLIGVIAGTYSSIFIASPVLSLLEGRQLFLLKTKKAR